MDIFDRTQMVQQIDGILESSSSLNDIIPILQHLSLSRIKSFIHEEMKEETMKTVRSIYFNASSIDEILPEDVMQHILSFGNLYHHKTVNKKWKLLSDRNQANKIRKLYHSLAISPLSNQASSTYIIHQRRKQRNAIESSLGFKGPMTLEEVARDKHIFRHGDRLLFHEGCYNYSAYMDVFSDLGIWIIGVNKNVLFAINTDRYHDYDAIFQINNAQNIELRIENISFTTTNNSYCPTSPTDNSCELPSKYGNPILSSTYYPEHPIYSEGSIKGYVVDVTNNNCNVVIKNCKFFNFPGVAVGIRSSSTLSIVDCSFINVESCVGVHCRNSGQINITNCLFERCGALTCSSSHKIHPIVISGCDESQIRLKCVGNVFRANKCYPIVRDLATYADNRRYEEINQLSKSKHCVFTDNEFC